MFNVFSRISLSVVGLLFAVLILLRAQPVDDHELRDLLLPKGCPAPCFAGIRPGITTVEEAVRILEGHDWVSKVTRTAGGISWEWNGGQAALLGDSRGGMITVMQDEQPGYPKGTVRTLGVFTTIPFGTLRLLLGDDQNHQHFSADALIDGRVLVRYPDLSIVIDTFVQCPTNVMRDWGQFRVIEYGIADYTLLGVSCQRIF